MVLNLVLTLSVRQLMKLLGSQVQTVDITPTLAAFLGIKPPSGSHGNVLVEVLGGQLAGNCC